LESFVNEAKLHERPNMEKAIIEWEEDIEWAKANFAESRLKNLARL
jgi:hypothetical protein